jgi:PEP-CTERM motif
VSVSVPEPASWALMISGFGLVGGAMRKRRTTMNVTFA